jgi:polyhydroxybutyrate depolymerase
MRHRALAPPHGSAEKTAAPVLQRAVATRVLLVAASAAVLALVGCGSSPSSDEGAAAGSGAAGSEGAAAGTGGGAAGSGGGSGSSGASGSAPVPSTGCGATAPAEGSYSVDVEGTTRSYYLVPATVSEPVPLVLSFHGYGGSGLGDVNTFGLKTTTQGEAVLVFPDGVAQSWYGDAIGWDTRSNSTPDIAFAQALIDEAVAKHCIDTSRIFMVGFSWGGWMSNQVACALGDQVRAFVSVAGGGPGGSCVQDVAGMIIHGEADGSEPIASGQDSLDKWTTQNGCDAASVTTTVTECEARTGCTAPLWWCQHTGGHEVPAFVAEAAWGFLMSAP